MEEHKKVFNFHTAHKQIIKETFLSHHLLFNVYAMYSISLCICYKSIAILSNMQDDIFTYLLIYIMHVKLTLIVNRFTLLIYTTLISHINYQYRM